MPVSGGPCDGSYASVLLGILLVARMLRRRTPAAGPLAIDTATERRAMLVVVVWVLVSRLVGYASAQQPRWYFSGVNILYIADLLRDPDAWRHWLASLWNLQIIWEHESPIQAPVAALVQRVLGPSIELPTIVGTVWAVLAVLVAWRLGRAVETPAYGVLFAALVAVAPLQIAWARLGGMYIGASAAVLCVAWTAWVAGERGGALAAFASGCVAWSSVYFYFPARVVGTDRAGGGSWDGQPLVLWAFGADGYLTRVEVFDTDHDAEALARFDELVSRSAEVPTTASRPARIETAAARWVDRTMAAWEARDWERVAAAYAPGFRLMDRRRMLRLELDRDGWLDNLRYLFEMRSSRFTPQLLATRGDRLALVWLRWEGSHGDVGPSEIEYLVVHEIDDHGDAVAFVAFDPDDLDAAYAELDARYAAGEAAPYGRTWARLQRFGRAAAARDWKQWASLFAPDYVVEDHRLLGWGTLHSRDEYLTYVRTLVDLSPDARWRLDHVLALDDWRWLAVVSAVGSQDGGPFEIPYVVVAVLGPDGRHQQAHLYDFDQLDVARACYETLAATVPPPRIENAATRSVDRFVEAWAAHDWEHVVAGNALDFRVTDRRKMVRIELDRSDYQKTLQFYFELRSSRFTRQVIATRSDRLALVRWRMEASDGDLGSSEIEFLGIHEVDDHGDAVALVAFDPDDLDAAYAELDARYAAGEAAAHADAPEPLQRVEGAGAPKP
jgi:hypothetical protein